MIGSLVVSVAELDAMMAAEFPCDMCQGKADMSSRGHSCRPAGFRSFKCRSCWIAWHIAVEMRIETIGCTHRECGMSVRSPAELSDYREM